MQIPGSGFRDPRELQDEVLTPFGPDVESYLGVFTTPGLPIAATRDSTIRGRSQATPTIQQHYTTKGVLPL